jgi:hypothetical protein
VGNWVGDFVGVRVGRCVGLGVGSKVGEGLGAILEAIVGSDEIKPLGDCERETVGKDEIEKDGDALGWFVVGANDGTSLNEWLGRELIASVGEIDGCSESVSASSVVGCWEIVTTGESDGTSLSRITGESDGNSLVPPLGDELGGSETTSSANVNGITIWDPSLKSSSPVPVNTTVPSMMLLPVKEPPEFITKLYSSSSSKQIRSR